MGERQEVYRTCRGMGRLSLGLRSKSMWLPLAEIRRKGTCIRELGYPSLLVLLGTTATSPNTAHR